MSWAFVAAVGCAALAGALPPARASSRRLDRLPPARVVSTGEAAGWRWPERLAARWFRRRTAEQVRASLVLLADRLCAELRAGASPRDAVWQATRDEPRFVAVTAAARSPAGDVASALREVAAGPGGAWAGDLATAWVVCESAGGRLATPVARLADAWRDDEQVRREVSAQLAGPRATALLLAALPLVGLAMGAALGTDPLALLRRPAVVLAVLVPGLLLEAAGLLWTARITRRAATW